MNFRSARDHYQRLPGFHCAELALSDQRFTGSVVSVVHITLSTLPRQLSERIPMIGAECYHNIRVAED